MYLVEYVKIFFPPLHFFLRRFFGALSCGVIQCNLGEVEGWKSEFENGRERGLIALYLKSASLQFGNHEVCKRVHLTFAFIVPTYCKKVKLAVYLFPSDWILTYFCHSKLICFAPNKCT